MGALLAAAADLLLGADCPGCGRAAVRLCRPCGEAIRPDPRPAWPDPVPEVLRRPTAVVPVAAGANADVLQRVILAWKEDGRFGLLAPLAALLAAAVVPALGDARRVVLVPVPTSRRSRRARGADVVDELAQLAARRLRDLGVDASRRQALGYARRTADQAGLDARQRAENLAGAFRLRTPAGLDGAAIVVVDDILTTGSTVVEAVRVLDAAGRRPAGVAVVAATPRRGARR